MKNTTNYGFKLPEQSDFYNIEHMNDNFAGVDEKLKEFEDGTTTVGNANKLGGKGASEYVSKNADGSVGSGLVPLELKGDYTASYLRFLNSSGNSFGILGFDGENNPVFRDTSGTNKTLATTADLANFDADTVDGHHAWQLQNVNAVKEPIGNYLYSQYEGTDNTFHIKNTDTSIRTKVDTCVDLANYLPKSGGIVGTGSTTIPFGVKGQGGSSYTIYFNHDESMLGFLGMNGANKPSYMPADRSTSYDILHTGNKPTGTYTGNGSATERVINTGGIGNVCIVWCPYSGQNALVYRYCALVFGAGGSVSVIDGAAFADGVLKISTDNAALNFNGTDHFYQVL